MISENKFQELISGARTLGIHGINGNTRHTENFYRNNKRGKWFGGSLLVVKNGRITDINDVYLGKPLVRRALFNRLKRMCEAEPSVYIDVSGHKIFIK